MHRCIKIALFFLFFSANQLSAQVNLKVGYGFSYQNMEETNKLLEAYNAQNTWLDVNFKELHYFQSLTLGLRYQWDFVRFELSWQKGFNRKKAEGINPLTDASFKKILAFNFDRYSLAYENYYRSFGIGASLDYNIYSIKSEINEEGKRRLVHENNLSSHFHISYTFANDSALKLMVKPYIQIPWTTIELNGLAQGLNQDNPVSALTEDTMSYGLMLIFYQGN